MENVNKKDRWNTCDLQTMMKTTKVMRKKNVSIKCQHVITLKILHFVLYTRKWNELCKINSCLFLAMCKKLFTFHLYNETKY